MDGKVTILVVDDEESTQNLLKTILEDAGYELVVVSTGKEAIDIVSSGVISLVLLDIVMPDMDGFKTLESIRKKSNIPVIMITGKGEITSLITSIDLGADDYIKKPFRSAKLLARVKAKLRRI
ncbi:response regulator transcription factor [Chloroflexota bacterium]